MFFKKEKYKPYNSASKRYQKEVDMQIKYFGRVSGQLHDNLKNAGLYLDKNNTVRERKSFKKYKHLY